MKNVLIASLVVFASSAAVAQSIPVVPIGQPASFSFTGLPLMAFAQATYKNLLNRDFVISPQLAGMDKKITMSVKSVPSDKLPAFIDELLLSYGVSSVHRGNVWYFDSVADRSLSPDRTSSSSPDVPVRSTLSDGAVVEQKSTLLVDHTPASFDPVHVYAPRNRPADFMVAVLNAAFACQCARLAGASVVLAAPEARLPALIDLASALDVAARSVEVAASFVEVTRSDSSARGLALVASVLSSKFGASFSAAAGSLTLSSGGYQLVLDALQADGRFKQVSNARLLGDDAERMLLTVGDETPTISSTGRDNQGNGLQNIVYRPSGVIIDVTPRVLGSGRLSLSIDGQISSFQSTVTGVTGSPTLVKRQVKTAITVGDGEVVIIGGLDDTKTTDRAAGFSFLPRSWSSSSASNAHTDLVLILSAKANPALNAGVVP